MWRSRAPPGRAIWTDCVFASLSQPLHVVLPAPCVDHLRAVPRQARGSAIGRHVGPSALCWGTGRFRARHWRYAGQGMSHNGSFLSRFASQPASSEIERRARHTRVPRAVPRAWAIEEEPVKLGKIRAYSTRRLQPARITQDHTTTHGIRLSEENTHLGRFVQLDRRVPAGSRYDEEAPPIIRSTRCSIDLLLMLGAAAAAPSRRAGGRRGNRRCGDPCSSARPRRAGPRGPAPESWSIRP